VTDDLAARTWDLVHDRPTGELSGPAAVMAALAAFRADPCSSTWYGFVARFALLIHEREARAQILDERCPYGRVTALAIRDADVAISRAGESSPT
jgi:hypothetical protein